MDSERVAIAFGTVVYHYDNSGRTLSETTGTGALIAEYVYANGKLAAVVKPDGVYYYHTDPAGSPLAMTNNSKTVVWKADYRPFGEEQSKTLNFSNDRMFAGKERDRETGMYYFGARYMRPETGRFTAIDPIGPVDARTGKVNDKMLVNPQRLNRYAYAGNNPYRFIDPYGQTWVEFVRSNSVLLVYPGSKDTYGPPRAFSAGNNTANPVGDPNVVGSNGPAPNGTFPVQNPVNTDGRPEYGPYFFPIGKVGSNGERGDIARQRGIGIHGGRRGPQSKTQGCIRVSDQTARELHEIHKADPLTTITIRERKND